LGRLVQGTGTSSRKTKINLLPYMDDSIVINWDWLQNADDVWFCQKIMT
jgi:hypothetical protein